MQAMKPHGRGDNKNKQCQRCKLMLPESGPDPCLGHLPGVKFACCGHGSKEGGYISFENGRIIRFPVLTHVEQRYGPMDYETLLEKRFTERWKDVANERETADGA